MVSQNCCGIGIINLKKNWVDMLDAFVISYNSTMHTAYKHTPHEVMFSWKMHCIYKTPDTNLDNEMDANSM